MLGGGRYLGLSWLLACAALACNGESTTKGGSDGNEPGAGTPTAAESFGSAFAAAYCQIGPCCQKEGYAFVPASCEATMKAYIDSAVNEQLAHAGVAYDAAAAATCIEAYRRVVTACTEPSLNDALNRACEGVFYGTVPEGGACTADDACADIPGASYVQCNEGVCTAERDLVDPTQHAKLGEACYGDCETGNGCSSGGRSVSIMPTSQAACYKDEGLYCTSQYVCAALPQIGEKCPDYACARNSYCNGDVCVASTASGPCPDLDECLEGSSCDYTTRMCIPLKANGSPCNYDAECASDKCDSELCRDWSVASTSTCAGLLND